MHSLEALSKLFGSLSRVKLLRLFVFNRAEAFSFTYICGRAKIAPQEARTELTRLIAAGFLKRTGAGDKAIYRVNIKFAHLEPLAAFIRATTSLVPADLLAALKKAGALRLVVLSGVFTGSLESTIDLLVVGDKLDEKTLSRAVEGLEALFGQEIRYTVFSTDEFSYRQGVYDRLLRDIFDYPHQALLDRIGL